MPVYTFACPVCHYREDHIRRVDERNNPALCPICAANHDLVSVPFMERDAMSEQTGRPPEMGYSSPMYSEALGVAPNQVDDARRRFPDHKFTPDGRMILESHKERNRVLKDLGFVDRS